MSNPAPAVVEIQLREARDEARAWRETLAQSLVMLAAARAEIVALRARLKATTGNEGRRA